MKKFTSKLRNIQETKFPLVKASFQGKDGTSYVGLMLIDTGSTNCILNKSVLPYLDESAVIKGVTKNIQSVQGKQEKFQGISFSFCIENGEFSDTFYVNSDMDFDQMFDCLFMGIVGHEFLRNNNLVLDYETETLHSSSRDFIGNPENYAFFFPMSLGLRQYDVPVIGLSYGEKIYVMIADSGANVTVITKHVLDDAGICAKYLGEDGTVTYFTTDTLESSFYEMTLSIFSIGGTSECPKVYSSNDKVQIIGNCQHIMDGLKDAEGNDILPVSGMLSSDFMLKNKWVLDFGAGVMFQRKETT